MEAPREFTLRASGSFVTVGVVLGSVTVGGLCRLYPPPAGPTWILLPAMGVASLIALVGLAFVAYRRAGERPVQWIVAGYVAVMLLWGTIALTEETVAFVRRRIPSTLGVGGV